MSIGKFSASGISLNNENTVALANIAVDVAFIRCSAPIEFSGIGTALTTKRKHEAENGGLHTTAVKLGYLFYDLVPETPKLIAAFGKRVSEILEEPGINPKGTEQDGPFRDFVGAECTSIWAAATSPRESLSLVLLACLLARAWSAKEATSIWVEIIDLRKQQISDQMQSGKCVSPYSMLAAQKDYTRSELSLWDASTRAWLSRADTAMHLRLTQFRLERGNVKMPFEFSRSTMYNVVTPWIQSMNMMEALLDHQPQELTSGVGLIAMSAWHLFPDLLVLQDKTTEIHFGDDLIPKSSVLSVAIEYDGSSENIARWSLSLSHLRHYGDPVMVRSSEDEQARVPLAQIWVAFLGIVFREWGVPYGSFDGPLEWLTLLHDLLISDEHLTGAIPPWVFELSKAAASVTNKELANSDFLIRYGYRKGNGHACDIIPTSLPAFGLRNPSVLEAVRSQTGEDRSAVYLRSIANKLYLIPQQGNIHDLYSNDVYSIPVSMPLAAEESDHDLITMSHHMHQHGYATTNPPAVVCAADIVKIGVFDHHGNECILSHGNYKLRIAKKMSSMTGAIHRKAKRFQGELVPWPEACELLRSAKPGRYKDGLSWALSETSMLYILPRPCMLKFILLRLAKEVCEDLCHDTVSLKVISEEISSTNANELTNCMDKRNVPACRQLELKMSVIAWMGTAQFDFSSDRMDNVFAIAFEDKIYIAELLFMDPLVRKPCTKIRCIVGNIGHSGMTLLVSPRQMRMRPPSEDPDSIGSVMHRAYDGISRDSFGSTTLHLSFTDWVVPLLGWGMGAFDSEVFILESFVSVRECGKWVADIDIMGFNGPETYGISIPVIDGNCGHRNHELGYSEEEARRGLVSIDRWEELLDFPPCSAVFRAHGNWAARLAAACISHQAKSVAEHDVESSEETDEYDTEESDGKTGKWDELGSAELVLVKGDKVCLRCIREHLGSDDNLLIIH